MGIPFPWEIINKKINGYFVHTGRYSLKLAGEHEPSYSCRRVEFDNYLFEKTKSIGVESFQTRVTELDFEEDGVMVYSESNNIKTDVVVGAFGLDDGMAKIFERSTSYRQPKFLSSIVTKIHPGENVGRGSDDTLFAKISGIVAFRGNASGKRSVSVLAEPVPSESANG